MHLEAFRDFCLSKAGSSEGLPFDEDTLIFKVYGKMFALCSLAAFEKGITLKCEPDVAVELRERFPQVKAGYHLSKLHWNTILPEAGLSDILLQEWINSSYALVVAKLTKVQQNELKAMP